MTHRPAPRRLIAGVAAAALGIALVPALSSPASASTTALPAGTTILSPLGATIAAADDGNNTNAHLLASVPKTLTPSGGSATNVAGVVFNLNVGTNTYAIGSSRTAVYSETSAQAFAYDWTKTAIDALVGTAGSLSNANLLADPIDASGNVIKSQPTGASTFEATRLVTVKSSAATSHLTFPLSADGTVGEFGGHVIAGGTSSGTAVAVKDVTNPLSPGANAVVTTTGPVSGVTSWKADVTLKDTAASAGAVVLNVATTTPAGDDESQIGTLYAQTPTKTPTTGAPSSVVSNWTGDYVPNTFSGNVSFTIAVKDQKGRPIVGAYVTDAGGSLSLSTPAPHQTNVDGLVVVTAPIVTGGADNDQTFNFQVAASSAGTKDPNLLSPLDFTLTKTLHVYAPVQTTVSSIAPAGAGYPAGLTAFDVAENASLNVNVLDQHANAFSAGLCVGYWFDKSVVSASGTTTTSRIPTTGVTPATTNSGTLTVANPVGSLAAGDTASFTLHAFIDKELNNTNCGTPTAPTLTSGDLGPTLLTGKVGTGDAVWAGDAYDPTTNAVTHVVQAGVGNTTGENVVLRLADGTPLVSRTLTLGYVAHDDSGFATGANAQNANVNVTSASAGSCVTDALGTCQVKIKDPAPATTPGTELGSTISAAWTAPSPLASGHAGQGGQIQFDLLSSLAAATVTFDSPTALFANLVTPGRPVDTGVTVKNANNEVLANVEVTFSVDHGFFTPYAATPDFLTPATTPVVGALYGDWKNVGSTVKVLSGSRINTDVGHALTTLAIGRDAGFDAIGSVNSHVTATVGSPAVTAAQDISWTSEKPLNLSSVQMVQRGGTPVLPNVHNADPDRGVSSDQVEFAVQAKDQFGNLTQAYDPSAANPVRLDISQNANAPADAKFDSNYQWTSATDFNQTNNGAAYAYNNGTSTGTQVLTVTLRNRLANTWQNNGTANQPDFQPATNSVANLTGNAPALNWYSQAITIADGAKYTFTLAPTGGAGNSYPVGTLVTVSVTGVDQFGRPLQGVTVQFVRSGPAGQSDNPTPKKTTNLGKAGYSFTGSAAGTATVTAVVTDSGGSELARNATTIVFGTASPSPSPSPTSSGSPSPTPSPSPTAVRPHITSPNTGDTFLAGTRVYLYGAGGNSGEIVTVYEKLAGQTSYTRLLGGALVNSQGNWLYRRVVSRTAYYYFKSQNGYTKSVQIQIVR